MLSSGKHGIHFGVKSKRPETWKNKKILPEPGSSRKNSECSFSLNDLFNDIPMVA